MNLRRLFSWPKINRGGGAGADGVWWPTYPTDRADTVQHFATYPPRAMRLPAVRRAVGAIAGDLARVPIKVQGYVGDYWADLGRTPEAIALNEQASEFHTANEFKRWVFSQCLIWGNGFALISRNGRGIDKLIPLDPTSVQMNVGDDGKWYYHTSDWGDVSVADMIHLRMPAYVRQLWGDSPVVDAARCLSLSSELETAGLEQYRMPGMGKIAITTQEAIGAESVRGMQDAFKSAHAGSEGMLRPIIAQNGATISQVGRSLVDQEWIQGRRQAIEDVARVYGIPPYVLFSESSAGFTIDQARMYADSLAAYTDGWAAEISNKLFPGQPTRVAFDMTRMLRGSFGEAISAYKEAVQLGVMTPNDVRRELGLPPIEGGDEMYVGPNMKAGGNDADEEDGNSPDDDPAMQ